MQHPDEGTIHTWLDGALPPEEASALEAHASSCARCSAAIAEARGLIAASSRIVSALDAVPAGVIPQRKAIARPWYASTKLRAAAAVLFVAGASMLLLRDQGTSPVEDLSTQVMSEAASRGATAPVSEMPPAGGQEKSSATAMRSAASSQETGSSQKKTEKKQAESDFRGRGLQSAQAAAKASAPATTADAAAPALGMAAPPPPPPPPPALQAPAASVGNVAAGRASAAAAVPRDSSGRRRELARTPVFDNVVVTGVAAEARSATEEFAVVRSDTSAGRMTVIYRTTSGAEVMLTEERTDGRSGAARVQSPPAPTPAASLPPAVSGSDTLPMRTIEWVDTAKKRKYRLSGQVSQAVLERLKAKIEESRR